MEKKPNKETLNKALKEALLRQSQKDSEQKNMPREEGGTNGKEPTRYGDWEKKGIAVDF